MRGRFTLLAALALAPLTAGGCGEDAGGDAGELTAVATTTHLADLVRNVAGGRVEGRSLVQPNSDPHEYEPRPSDARAVSAADVVFRSGGEIDEWLDDVLEGAGTEVPEVDLIDSVETVGDDPHWWQDPRNAIRAVAAIRDALAESDPAGRSDYDANARRYTGELRTLDRAIAACLADLPRRSRKLVTTHDALQYFARRYDLEVIGSLIPSLSSQAQPSAKDTVALVERLREQDVRAIFPESALNPKLERAVAREAGVDVETALFTDSLGPPGSATGSYVDAMTANATVIARGLSGSPCR